MTSTRIFCDLCKKEYGLRTALITHKLNKHKLFDKQSKTSALIADATETVDLIYSSDSECEYRITTKIERIPKTRKPLKTEMHLGSYEITFLEPEVKLEENVQSESKTYLLQTLVDSLDAKPKAIFQCIYCKKMYKNKSNLTNHLECYHSRNESVKPLGSAAKAFHCKHCDQIFSRRLHYEHHLTSLRKDTPFFCKICHSGFNTKPELLLHKRNNAECQNAPKSKLFLCTYCGKYFERKNSLTIHTRIHTNEKPFICSTCGKSFIMKSTLREHMNSHLGVKPYACPVAGCDKQFGFASGLRQHRLNMHEPPTFKCPFCDRMFAKKVHMESHSRSHTGEKPFKCEFCPMLFRLTSSLRIHRRTHTGERPFKCDICNKGFIKSYGLVVHRRNQKKCVPPPETGRKMIDAKTKLAKEIIAKA